MSKPVNRSKPGRKKGVPKDHEGHTLRFPDTPDEIVEYEIFTYSQCACSLEYVPELEWEKR
jgi:hypothetical protein